jgi:hypothetical protein
LVEDSCTYVQIYRLPEWSQSLHLKVVLKDNSRLTPKPDISNNVREIASADVRLAESLRTILGAAGRKLHKHVTVEIIETTD